MYEEASLPGVSKGDRRNIQCSNAVRDVLKAIISSPWDLTEQQCLDGVKACSRKLTMLKDQAGD
jgi:hypothetical protein